MLTKTRFQTLVAAVLVAALSASLSGPAAADERVYQPIQAITEEVGSKHIAGYFVNNNDRCQVVVMVEELWDPAGDTPGSMAARLRFDLEPNETASVDSAENESVSLTCGEKAETLVLHRPYDAYAYVGR